MGAHSPGLVRAVALVGPTGTGKTNLMEALLAGGAGAQDQSRPGSATPAPRPRPAGTRSSSTSPASTTWTTATRSIDRPGAVDCAAEGDFALPAVDLAVVVAAAGPGQGDPAAADPEGARAARRAAPDLRQPHRPGPRAAAEAAGRAFGGQRASGRRAPDADLGGRARHRLRRPRPGAGLRLSPGRRRPSSSPSLGDDVAEEKDARFHMLEQLADFDDELLEQLVSDVTPEQELVFADLVRELNEGLIVPGVLRRRAQGLRHARGC